MLTSLAALLLTLGALADEPGHQLAADR